MVKSMKKAAYTPGPWTYDYAPISSGDTAEFMITTLDLALVAHVWPDAKKDITGGTVEANARLIAAAPVMHAMLCDLLDRVENMTALQLDTWLQDARRVVAKAGGKP